MRKSNTSEPKVILESASPVCDIQAFVEKSESCYYFYLWINPISDNPEMRSCWICNRNKSPKKMDFEAMGKGMAPMMPEEFVLHDKNGIDIDESKLSIIWFAEGDAASLLCGDELLCVIPGWSGNGFPGYSKYAKGTSPLGWELTMAEQALMARTLDNKKKWDYFEEDYWKDVQMEHIRVLESFFGKHEKYYAIDGGKFPPKALLRGTKNDITYGITAGVSLLPMPKAEMYFQEEVNKYRRIELGFACDVKYDKLCELMCSMLSSLSRFPWGERTFLANGHTIPFKNIKGYEALLFVNPKNVVGVESPEYKTFMDDEINILWVVPITEKEYKFVMDTDIDEMLKHAVDIKSLNVFDGKGKFDI